jgi:hypothetical protein
VQPLHRVEQLSHGVVHVTLLAVVLRSVLHTRATRLHCVRPTAGQRMGDVGGGEQARSRAYEGSRAAAFAGVPLRTLYHCARDRFVPPSGSATGERLCSYRDLLALRLMRWLRTDTPEAARAAMTQFAACSTSLVTTCGGSTSVTVCR